MKLLLAVLLLVGVVVAQDKPLTPAEQDALAIQPDHLPVEDSNAVEGTLGGLSAAMAAYIAFMHRKLKKVTGSYAFPKENCPPAGQGTGNTTG